MKVNEELQRYAGTGKKVRLFMRIPSEPRLNGYILSTSESLVLMHSFDDFEPDGYVIVRVKDTESVRRGAYEEWWDHMLASEQLLGGLESPPNIDITDMSRAIESASKGGRQLIVQCEDLGRDVEDFYIGSVVAVNANEILFRHYDGLGFWSDAPVTIATSEITKVQFDTPYIRVFSKYTRERGTEKPGKAPAPAEKGVND